MSTKLRILALHGYGQNAAILRSRTGAIRKAFRDLAEFDFVDGLFPMDPPATSPDLQTYRWWAASDLPGGGSSYQGWEDSLNYVTSQYLSASPHHYDGIMGFSQGATLGLLLSVRHSQMMFAWLFGPFLPRDDGMLFEIRSAAQEKSVTKYFLVHGEDDQIVAWERCSPILEHLNSNNVVLYRPPVGHVIPSRKSDIEEFRRFLEPFHRAKQALAAQRGTSPPHL